MKTAWVVKYEGKITQEVIYADTFLEAVEEAKLISEKIISINYLAY
jgi:hypothetical protein